MAIIPYLVAVIRFGRDATDQQTCNQTGPFTLLENDYFSVTAEAEPLPFDEVCILSRPGH